MSSQNSHETLSEHETEDLEKAATMTEPDAESQDEVVVKQLLQPPKYLRSRRQYIYLALFLFLVILGALVGGIVLGRSSGSGALVSSATNLEGDAVEDEDDETDFPTNSSSSSSSSDDGWWHHGNYSSSEDGWWHHHGNHTHHGRNCTNHTHHGHHHGGGHRSHKRGKQGRKNGGGPHWTGGGF